MEKQASNTFVGGLNTDRHPLTSQNTELIDAQNIDLLQVGEGYQLILQKREGNTEVLLDSNGDGVPDVPNVSAGVPDGFIPLAVKEFNNIAYIVSVNPTTQQGELGTFPSPDYNSFEYVTGAPIGGGATIEASTYDPTADTAEYSYSFTEVAGTGSDETVDGNENANYPLTQAGFTIVNTGLNIESYDFELNSTTGIKMYTNGVEFIHGTTSPYTLSPGASVDMVIKVNDALAITPANTVITRILTITPQDDPTPTTHTHTFAFHTTIVMQVKDLAGTWRKTFPITPENVTSGGQLLTYEARTNAGVSMSYVLVPTPADTWITLVSGLQISISANSSGLPRTGSSTITGTHSGGSINCVALITQATS